MAVFQVETGSCTGRGFLNTHTDGFLKKFRDWIVKAPASGGPGWYVFDDTNQNNATNPYIVICDVAAPSPNEVNTGPSGRPPKFAKVGYITAETGYIRIQYGFWWNAGTKTLHGIWGGHRIATYDSVPFAYSFRGGAECLCIMSITSVYSFAMIDEFTHSLGFLEDDSAVTTAPGSISPGVSIVVPVADATPLLPLLNKYVYISNFNNASHVEYCYVNAVDDFADTITVATINSAFGVGSVIGAYPHRFYSIGNTIAGDTDYQNFASVIPYYSDSNPIYCFHVIGNVIYSACQACDIRNALLQINPDDYGKYSCEKPFITELYRNQFLNVKTNMNRAYGRGKNVRIAKNNSYVQLQDGLSDNDDSNKEFLFVGAANESISVGSSSNGVFILNTTSLV